MNCEQQHSTYISTSFPSDCRDTIEIKRDFKKELKYFFCNIRNKSTRANAGEGRDEGDIYIALDYGYETMLISIIVLVELESTTSALFSLTITALFSFVASYCELTKESLL